jgi:transposase
MPEAIVRDHRQRFQGFLEVPVKFEGRSADIVGMKKGVENELFAAIRRLQKTVDRQAARIAELETVIAQKDKRIAELEAALAKAKKNSSTSSKPPSTDIVKPPRERRQRGKRKIGGQPGHPKHERPAFTPDEVAEVHVCGLTGCPGCGGLLTLIDDDPRTIQQMDLRAPENPTRVDEYRGLVYWCDTCQCKHTAPLPLAIEKGGLLGPRLTAMVAYLKGVCHASFSTIRKYFRDVLCVKISRGQLVKVVQKVSTALDAAYNELMERLSLESHLNIDETGHKENGDPFYTWCFRAEAFTFFRVVGTRSSDILFDILGREFDGVIGCDYFSAYRKYMKDCSVLVQFCLAHVIRDIKYLTTLKAPSTVAYGERLLQGMSNLFKTIHAHDGEDSEALRDKLQRQGYKIIALATEEVPGTREAQNMAKRFEKHGHAYFQFIMTPGLGPTNNAAEQAIRFVVIDRLVTQGTRSERGRQWCERIWTVMATCARQGRSAYDFILESVEAHFNGRPGPSLLPQPSPG